MMGTLELTAVGRLTLPRRADGGVGIAAWFFEVRPEAAPLEREEVLFVLGQEGKGSGGGYAPAGPPVHRICPRDCVVASFIRHSRQASPWFGITVTRVA